MNNKEIVKSIQSPFKNLKGICKTITEDELIIDLEELDTFDISKLIPKVIDDDAIGVYEYLEDGNLYLIDEDGIAQVTPVHILFPEDGYVEMDEGELFEKYDCTFSGEADDLTCYVYFKEVM